MAEALINQLGGGQYRADSAGSSPAGYVHPLAIETLQRHGIASGRPRSKSWDEFKDHKFDLVITVCDRVASEKCPLFSGESTVLHWSIPDPAAAEGDEQQRNQAFDAAFRLLRGRIESELL